MHRERQFNLHLISRLRCIFAQLHRIHSSLLKISSCSQRHCIRSSVLQRADKRRCKINRNYSSSIAAARLAKIIASYIRLMRPADIRFFTSESRVASIRNLEFLRISRLGKSTTNDSRASGKFAHASSPSISRTDVMERDT